MFPLFSHLCDFFLCCLSGYNNHYPTDSAFYSNPPQHQQYFNRVFSNTRSVPWGGDQGVDGPAGDTSDSGGSSSVTRKALFVPATRQYSFGAKKVSRPSNAAAVTAAIRAAALHRANNSNAVETAASLALRQEQAAEAARLAAIEEQQRVEEEFKLNHTVRDAAIKQQTNLCLSLLDYQFGALLALRGSSLSTIVRNPATSTPRQIAPHTYQMRSVADILGLDRSLSRAGDPVPLLEDPHPEPTSQQPAPLSAIKRQTSIGSTGSSRSVNIKQHVGEEQDAEEVFSQPLPLSMQLPVAPPVDSHGKVKKLSRIQPPSKTAMRAAAAAAGNGGGPSVPSSPALSAAPSSTPVKAPLSAAGGSSTPSAAISTTPRTKQNTTGGITAAGAPVTAPVNAAAAGVINAGTEASPRYFSASPAPPAAPPHTMRQLPVAPISVAPTTPANQQQQQQPTLNRTTSVDVNSAAKRVHPAQPALNRGQSTPVGGGQRGPGLPPPSQQRDSYAQPPGPGGWGGDNYQQQQQQYNNGGGGGVSNNNYNNSRGAWGAGRDYPQDGGYDYPPDSGYHHQQQHPQAGGAYLSQGRGRSRSRSPPPNAFYDRGAYPVQGGGGGSRGGDYRADYRGGGYDDYNYPPPADRGGVPYSGGSGGNNNYRGGGGGSGGDYGGGGGGDGWGGYPQGGKYPGPQDGRR